VAGVLLLVLFVFVELRTESPLMQVRIFRIRAFAVETAVLGIASLAFVPIFFFASEYAQISLDRTAQNAGIFLLYFFLGFAVASQIGGRILDRRGAKRPVFIGCALAAVGFGLWAGKVTQLNLSSQVWTVVITGAGMGLMLTPSSTDAVNRASRLSYGEATGITQTVRNYAASLGFAILGTILVTQLRSQVTSTLVSRFHVSPAHAAAVASTVGEGQNTPRGVANIPHWFRLDFAFATRDVFYVMCGIMAVAAVVAFLGLVPGLQEETTEAGDVRGRPSSQPSLATSPPYRERS
jgi:MFS family permease